MPAELHRYEQQARMVIWGIALCMTIIAGLLMYAGYRTIFRPPPFKFSQDVYLPLRGNICPGDTVEWQSQLTVHRAPSLLAVSRTLWDQSRQTTALPDQQLDFFIWLPQDQGRALTRTSLFRLPPTLPVGMYEVRVAASSFNSDAAAYRVPFVIAESCFKKEHP